MPDTSSGYCRTYMLPKYKKNKANNNENSVNYLKYELPRHIILFI